jgi:hypothetical protein
MNMWSLFIALRSAVRIKVRQLTVGLAVAALSGGLFAQAVLAADQPKNSDATTWGGIGWGIGLAADFDLGGSRVANATLVNNIVRITDTSSNVGIGFVLEAHYFLRDYEFAAANVAKNVVNGMCKYYCDVDVAVGPFVAIEVGGGSSATPANGGPITGYALGVMVGLHHPDASRTSSWNFGIGYRIDPKAQVLGDGIKANQPLPAGETAIRFKTEPRGGVMLLSSFSF